MELMFCSLEEFLKKKTFSLKSIFAKYILFQAILFHM